MEILIEINCDNAAFEIRGEIDKVLHQAATKIRLIEQDRCALGAGHEVGLLDTNGNTCGKVTVIF